MTEPREIVETTTTTWVAVAGPRDCLCGHQHYGRKAGAHSFQAPQWAFCEDAACTCNALRPTCCQGMTTTAASAAERQDTDD